MLKTPPPMSFEAKVLYITRTGQDHKPHNTVPWCSKSRCLQVIPAGIDMALPVLHAKGFNKDANSLKLQEES